MSNNKAFEEGLERMKQAEKSLKTSFLKWKPEYEIAGRDYMLAATSFKIAKAFEQSRECLLKASECFQLCRSFYFAAKFTEEAILLSKDLNDYGEVMELAERACYMYQLDMSRQCGAASLCRAATILEENNPEQAISLYQKAVDMLMVVDDLRKAAHYISKIARIMVKLQMYDQAADAIRREIALHQEMDQIPCIERLVIALVLVQLARGDYVAAEKAFKEWGNCCNAPQVQNLEMLLQGFDDEDPDMVRKALNHSYIKFMDVEYARLARDLPLPEGISAPKVSVIRENAADSYISPRATGVTTADIENPNIPSASGENNIEDDAKN